MYQYNDTAPVPEYIYMENLGVYGGLKGVDIKAS